MKKNKIILFSLIIIVIISGICVYTHFNKENTSIQANNESMSEENEKQNNYKSLINIEECSDEFMEEYFEGMGELQENNNKENIVIVTSKNEIKDGYGASKIVAAPNNQYFLQYDSEEEKNKALAELDKIDDIIEITENKIYQATGYNSWGVEKTGLDYAIEVAEDKNLNDVTVAIIDTGCNIELLNQYYPGKIKEAYNALNPNEEVTDSDGHGTHIAGTIAESTPKNVKILPIKVAIDGKTMYLDDIIEAVNYVTFYEKADVINMSYGGDGFVSQEYQAIEAANQKNIICVAAAGNDYEYSVDTPAAYDNTIAISAVNENLEKCDFSNYGSEIHFAAPGENIASIDESFVMDGTSMATPHVVSAVSILKSYNKDLTIDNSIELLRRYAIDLGPKGHDVYYGYGLINFNNAEFYDGEDGDEFNVFKKYTKVEIPATTPTEYNYGNITNLMNTEMRFYYNEQDYYIKQFWELDDLEITGYDPYSYTNQIVTAKYDGKTITFNVNNTKATKAGWIYEKDANNQLTITSFNGAIPKKVYLPERLDGFNVKKIGDSLFTYVTIKSAIIPEGVTSIGSAFEECFELENVSLPGSLIEIGDYAFSSDYNLKNIDIPNGVKTIGEGAFFECTELTTVILNEGLNYIGRCAFSNTNINELIIPNSVKTIGEAAFSVNYNLEKVIIGTGIENISDYAFCDCVISEVTISENVKTLGIKSFAYNYLEEITIPNSVTIISQGAFEGNGSLEKVIIGENVETIGDGAFYDCVISEITIPETVKTLGTYVFAYNYLEEITIPNSIITIPEGAFEGNYYLEKVTIGENVETIGDGAFYDCAISEITISETVKTLGEFAFAHNYLEEITIPNSIETIPEGTFAGNFYLTKVNIDEGLKEIGDHAFYIQENIPQSIEESAKDLNKRFVSTKSDIKTTINKSNTSNELQNRQVDMPKTIEKIGIDAFYNDTSLPYILYVYTNSTSHEYAKTNNIEYICKDPNEVIAHLNKTEYKAFETIDAEDLYLELKYEDGRTEEITEGIDIEYINEDSLRAGDKYFIASAYNEFEEYIEKQVNVTVSKLIPEFKIPTDLMAAEEQTLSEVVLPEGFEWEEPNTIIDGIGNLTFKAIYTPKDTENYEIVPDVEITIFVVNLNPTKPENVKLEGTYTYNGQEQTAIITGFDSETMNIEGNVQTDAGTYTIKISSKTGKWSDKTTEPITIEWIINKKTVKAPTFISIDIEWDGQEHSMLEKLDNNYNEELMEIEGTVKATDSGEYSFEVKLKDSKNYKWENEIEKVEFEWKILKVTIIPNITVTEKIYDGTTSLENENIIIANLNIEDYTIVSATLSSANIGDTKAKIKIKLSDDKFVNHNLNDGLQEYEYTVDVTIIPAEVAKPSKVDKVYTYNGKEQEIELNNFDSKKMVIKNGARKNAGKQTVVISLINDNYIWEDDNSTIDIEFNFEIEKAQLTVTPNNIRAKVNNELPIIKQDDYVLTGAFEDDIAIPNFKIAYETEPDMTQEGIYNIIATGDAEIENYRITYNKGTLTITNKDIQNISFKDISEKTFGDQSFNNEVTGVLSTNGVKYESSDEKVATIDNKGTITINSTGITTIIATALEDDNYSEARVSYELTVNKLKLIVPTVTKKYVYNGQEQTIEVNNSNKHVTIEGITGKNAGEYVAIAKLNDKTNTIWEDGTVVDKEIVWNIAKADPIFEIPTDLTATIGDNIADIELGEGFTWQEDRDLTLGSDNYLATYTPEDTDNYNIITNIPISIETKMYNIEWLDDKEFVLKIDADYELFTHTVRVDGKEIIEGKDYTSKSGSTIIDLEESFVNTLLPGEHILEVDFENEVTAKVTFKIAAIEEDVNNGSTDNTENTESDQKTENTNSSNSVKTGDSIVTILIILAIGVCGFVVTKKKINSKKNKN